MTPMKRMVIGFVLLLIQACSHPIEIVGEGDVISASGTRNCLLEDFEAQLSNCTQNYVAGAYQETYTAVPRPFWFFDRWKNYCVNATNNQCAFNVPAASVQQYWGATVYPLQAIFAKHQLTGPVLPDSLISLGLGPVSPSYQVKEFFLTGTANSYTPSLPLPSDGKLVVTADPDSANGSYKTRLVVVRPINPADFNGTVIVEWLNVTAGADAPPDWIMAHNEFMRQGYAWIGVSAQAVGVNALKNAGGLAGVRYASLAHPGDSYSYSMFSHAGVRAAEPASRLLGGLTAERVIAAGESQSASRMVTYIDAIQPIENIYDGFMVHSRSGSGSSIAQAPLTAYPFPAPAPIRDDLAVPVMVVQAEGDVISSNLAARQPDTPLLRQWEMAGTSHADAYTLQGLNDNGDGSAAIAMFGYMRAPNNPFGCDNPINAGGHHWIMQAAFRALDTWVRTGVAPPVGPPLLDISSSPVVLQRDAFGNALGGVRSPHVDVPVATLDSVNGGVFLCRLFGRTIPFSTEQVLILYPTKDDFMTQWLDAINDSVVNGFLLAEDVDELTAAADAWDFPN
jgi:hypothetical protein